MHALKLVATIDSSRRVELQLPPDTPEGEAEVIVLVTEKAALAPAAGGEDVRPSTNPTAAEPDDSLEQVFAAIDRMPRQRLTKEEIDRYIAGERASWD